MNNKRTTKDVFPRELAQALTSDIAAVDPPPSRKQAMRERVLAAVRAAPSLFLTVRSDDGTWQHIASDIAVKVLDRDDSMQAFLLRLDAGACLPAHPHTMDEMCFVLEGDAKLGDFAVGPGDYHMARAGSEHGDITTRNGCLLLIRYGGAAVTSRISPPTG
jgi:anti-sigma factor ChrR (cupin superfamily)